MLSDESSSDSETGRFKCKTKSQDVQSKTNKREESFRSSVRSRPEGSRYQREIEKNKEEKDRYDKHNRDRNRYRHSPIRRRYSQEKPSIRSHDRYKSDKSDRDSKNKYRHSDYRDKRRDSRSRSRRPADHKKDLKDEIRRTIPPERERKSVEKYERKSKERKSLSPHQRGKRSEVYKPPVVETKKDNSVKPEVVVPHSDESEEVQPGSYYSMIPALVKEKSEEESSEIDSSDDEKLRAKLLNLEKELHKTKKRKHKKKHKKKHSKSTEREQESTNVEVTSTTDIQDNVNTVNITSKREVVEVSSTEKIHKDSGEEGEILSDDSQSQYENDPNDLRHKLKRSAPKPDLNTGVCGPALPPHLEKQYKSNKLAETEGPALPPHLEKKSQPRVGPNISDDMRKKLSENDCVIKSEGSDDEGIGPLAEGLEHKWSHAHQSLEERALDMKIRKLDGDTLQKSEVKSREQWMLELPEGKAKYLGLEARGFRPKEGPDMSDRSSWTDTPEDKARKAAGIEKIEDADVSLRREARARQIADRDEQQEEVIKKHKKKHKREESLLELHEKKLKKKKKKDDKDEEKKERRPFNRDVDLQVNRFDEAQKKSIIKKAQNLDSRFSRGEAKYL